MACSACNIVVLLWWYIFALYSHLWPLYCVKTGFNDLHFSLDTAEYLYTYACVIVSIDTGRVSGHLWFGGELLVICVSVGGDLYLSLSIVICIRITTLDYTKAADFCSYSNWVICMNFKCVPVYASVGNVRSRIYIENIELQICT